MNASFAVSIFLLVCVVASNAGVFNMIKNQGDAGKLNILLKKQ